MMDWDLFATPAPLINMAARAFARIGERKLKAIGFSVGQMPVLYLLKDGNSLTQKELALFAKIEQPSMAQTLARMERDGLIQRTPDLNDGRSSLISLTEHALKMLPTVRELLHQGSEAALNGFSKEEIATLFGLLIRLNQNLDVIVTEPPTP